MIRVNRRKAPVVELCADPGGTRLGKWPYHENAWYVVRTC
ncbi:DUF6355 family natural product biosynthesis protein [Allokutzneria sp. NRRL B-24872]|nr:DUF6355 family natural product biosynthesis protein [Allokutzneria sp. NRRL B-24872]